MLHPTSADPLSRGALTGYGGTAITSLALIVAGCFGVAQILPISEGAAISMITSGGAGLTALTGKLGYSRLRSRAKKLSQQPLRIMWHTWWHAGWHEKQGSSRVPLPLVCMRISQAGSAPAA